MKETMNELLLNAASKMTENCRSMDFIMPGANRHLPERDVIIGILKDLRRVMFPGFFGDENITLISPEYFIGDRLTHICTALRAQVKTALLYRDYGQYGPEELDEKAETVCARFFERLPGIQQLLLKDVQAEYDGDPAAKSREEVIFSYPGLFAIFVYRIAHEFYVQDVPFLPRIMTEYAHSRTGIDINPGAVIGEYFCIDHGTGIVIGETTEIGDHVKLYQGVTLGALSTRSGHKLSDQKRHPTIEDHVVIYSGASILGGETVIGEGVIVAGGAFVTKSVPPFTKVVVKNPELQLKDSDVMVELQSTENKEGLWEI